MKVGVGLWTFQSTAAHPTSVGRAYREFAAQAAYLEGLGFDDVWLGEHRLWYDAWCPSPLMPLASAATATRTLGLGTAMVLLPQHDPIRVASTAATLDAVSGGRVQLGVGLGHRDAEFDAFGIARNEWGARMDAALDALLDGGFEPARVWVGGMADAALDRLGRRGMSCMLPQSLSSEAISRAIGRIRAAAESAGVVPGRIGMLKDVWVGADSRCARDWFLPQLAEHYREEAGAWWVMKAGGHGFTEPEALHRQVARVVDSAVVGAPHEVAGELRRFAEQGIDHLVVRCMFDFTAGQPAVDACNLFAAAVLPELAAAMPPGLAAGGRR